MVGEPDDTDPSVMADLGFDDADTERDITPVPRVRLRLALTPVLRLDDGAWWEDD
jgi:hypothetical protein